MSMKIGEFAAFCNISVRALHLYDRIGLLKPAHIDAESGYRYYDPDQMQALYTIVSFRKVGFSLKEIKGVLSSGLRRDVVIKKLRAKQRDNARTAAICRFNNQNIQNMLDALGAAPQERDEQAEALRLSRIARLENDKLEYDFSRILWL